MSWPRKHFFECTIRLACVRSIESSLCHGISLVFRALTSLNTSIFSSPEPKAQVSYCHSASSVRPSVNFHIFNFFFRTAWWILIKLGKIANCAVAEGWLFLDIGWFVLFLVAMKYSWSLTSVVFSQIRQNADPGRGKNRSRGPPSSRIFFRPEGYSNKSKGKQWSRGMWEEVLLFLVPFRSQIFDALLTSFWT